MESLENDITNQAPAYQDGRKTLVCATQNRNVGVVVKKVRRRLSRYFYVYERDTLL